MQDETVWLTQKQMEELFQKDIRTINEHLKNIYAEGELVSESTIRKFRIVGLEGMREVARSIDHYNLDAIISVGYRVNSIRGTQFRIWATQRLREYQWVSSLHSSQICLYNWQRLNQIGLHFGIGLSGVSEARRRVELQIKADKN